MKNIITLDYELYLDDIIGTVNQTLIVPMKHLMEVCKKYNVKATVFVDAAYLYMLDQLKDKYPQLAEDYQKVVEHIQFMDSEGYDIELHIHPQWYYSSYDDATGWNLDWDHYKLSTAPYEESLELFTHSKQLLENVLGKKVKAYRAGGYCIQGFNYVDCFRKNGITADSSVVPERKVKLHTHSFDFTGAPHDVYRFSNNVIQNDAEGEFLEFPISVMRMSFFSYLYKRRKLAKKATPRWGDGGALPKQSTSKFIDRFKYSFSWIKHASATIDWGIYGLLEEVRNYNEKAGNNYVVILGHPKNITPSSMEYLDGYIQRCLAKGDTFTTIKEEINKV